MGFLDKAWKKATNALKHPGKTIKNAVKDAGRDIGWKKWGQGALLGVATMGVGNVLKAGIDAQKKMAEAQAAGYDKLAASLQSQPTANASIAAGAVGEQNAGKRAEEGVQSERKRRRSLSSTVNSGSLLGASAGGVSGYRKTLG